MMKLMIVDDEQLILDGLKVIINWKELGVEIIGTASNGIEALKLALSHEVDIVLTDIRMPEMNGLELIRNISKKLPKTRCILLTGYQEFEYAREALKYGASGYLMKPVVEKELCELINSIREKWMSDNYEKNKIVDLNQKLIKTSSYMRNQLLYSMVSGECDNLDEIMMMLHSDGLKDFPERYVCFIIDMELEQRNGTTNPEESELVKFAVANIVDDIIKNRTGGIVFYTYETKVICLLELKENEAERVEKVLRDILLCIKNFLKIPIIIGVSSIHCGLKSMSVSYKEAYRTLKYKMLAGNIIYYKDIEESINIIYNIPLKTEKKLVNCIICGDSGSIPEIVDEFCKDISNANVDLESFIFALRDVIALIRRNVTEMGYDVSKFIQQVRIFFENADKHSLNDLKKGITRLLMDLAEEVSTHNLGGSKAFIAQIRQYIDENYSEQLTLNMISDKFYIHSSYFSRLFKKETSGNFIDYLTKKRIDEGKRLLLGTDLKIYEISERVGYGNSRYFSQLFEKHTGINPKEYRDIENKKNI